MFICMYVCMHVCTKSFLKTTTNSSCVCTHLANKADSDSDSDSVAVSRNKVMGVHLYHPPHPRIHFLDLIVMRGMTTTSLDLIIKDGT